MAVKVKQRGKETVSGSNGPAPMKAVLYARVSSEEQREKQTIQSQFEDRRDVEEAERRLADPNEVPIPYEHAGKELGLA